LDLFVGNILNTCLPSNAWEFSNSDLGNLYNCTNYYFVRDRFCSPNSAIYLDNGYLQAPADIYFAGDFSITAWIYLKSYGTWSRIIDFGNGSPMDNVNFGFFGGNSQLFAEIFQGNSPSTSLVPTVNIQLYQWYEVAFVVHGSNGYVYINGVLQATGIMNPPKNVLRTSNYIGK
jgi:hypothetical protein